MTEYKRSDSERIADILQRRVQRFCDIGTVMPSFHSDAEIVYVTKGALEIIVNGKRHTVSENTFAIIMPNMLHELRYSPPIDFWTLNIPASDFPEFFGSKFAIGLSFAYIECDDPYAFYFYDVALNPMRALENRKVSFMESENILDNLLYSEYTVAVRNILEKLTETVMTFRIESEDEVFLTSILRYIADVYLDHTSLVAYANNLGVYEYTLRRRLKSFFGRIGYSYTFADLVNMRRVEYARYLLRNTDFPICKIASESGLLYDARLRKFFMRFTGTRLKGYREHFKLLDGKNYIS